MNTQLPKLSELSNEQVRVMIATHFGFRLKSDPYFSAWANSDGEIEAPPNYPEDLNACAEMEATLLGKAHPSAVTDEMRLYRDRLAAVCKVAWYQSASLIFATALQRCYAFLLTHNLATL